MKKRPIAGVVALLVIAFTQVAEASFIQPDSGSTDGGSFNASYPVENLWGGADDSVAAETDTIDSTAANGGNGYASANPPAAGYPVTITLDFTVAQELSAFYLWNSNGGGNANPTLRGIKNFSLKFWNGAGGSGTQISSTYTNTAAKAIHGGLASAEAFVFPSSYVGVHSVELIIADNHNTSDWVGAREVGFETAETLPPPPDPFVQPDSATTDGGTFNGTYFIDDLVGGALDSVASSTDTINADSAISGNGWASANLPTAGYPITVTMNFSVAQDLNSFHLWNASGGGLSGPPPHGVKDFSLEFFDATAGGGTSRGTVTGLSAAQAPQTGDYAAEEFPFASVDGVQSVVMTIANNHEGTGTDSWTGIREVGFKGQASPIPAGPRIVVYLIGGQSNADGYGNPAELSAELAAPLDDVLFYHGNGGGLSPLTDDTWIALQPGSGSKANNAGFFGPEIGFGHALFDAYGAGNTTIAIIKHTKGATKLFSDWFPGGDDTTAGDGALYQAFQSTVNAGLAALAVQNPESTIQLEGMLWHQGEGDALSIDNYSAYENNLTNFIADVRSTYASELRFGIVQLSNNQVTIDPTRLASVKQAQANVAAADPLTCLITTDDLPTIPGNTIHFGADSQLTIGSRLVTGLLQLPLMDADGNGIDDDWEIKHWGTTGQDAEGNPDLDTYTNLEEFILDTSPLVSNVLSLGIALETDSANLSWIGTTNRRYMIEHSSDLETWSKFESFIPGTAGTNSYEGPPLQEQAFYRIHVQR